MNRDPDDTAIRARRCRSADSRAGWLRFSLRQPRPRGASTRRSGSFAPFFGLFQLEVGTARPALPLGGGISPAAGGAWCAPAVLPTSSGRADSPSRRSSARSAAIAAFCVLVAFERIHWGAWLLVSVGIGMQLGRLCLAAPIVVVALDLAPGARRKRCSRWWPCCIGRYAARSSAESSALAALPPARVERLTFCSS